MVTDLRIRTCPLGLWIICFIRHAFAQSQAVCTFEVPSVSAFELEETTEPGTRIFGISYHPADAVISGISISGDLVDLYKNKFEYNLKTGGNASTGNILEYYVNGSLTLPPYPSQITRASLRAQALCNGTPYAIAVLRIKAVNRFAPWFYGLPYKVNVSEATIVGSSIETFILAIDWDPSPEYTATFKLASGNQNDTFTLEQPADVAVNPQSFPRELSESLPSDSLTTAQLPRIVRLRLTKPLDYDAGIRRFVLNISVSDNGGALGLPPRLNWTIVTVDVLDSNDLPPIFDSKLYHGSLRRDAPPTTPVHVSPPIRARDGDIDINATVKYYIEQDRWIASYFSIDRNTGVITLQQSLPSNYTSSEVDLIVKAEEIDNPSQYASAFVHIALTSSKSDQQLPTFLQCDVNVSIPENAVYGTLVARMSAVDFDEGEFSQFTYQLVNQSEAEPFYLGAHSGLLIVHKPELLSQKMQNIWHVRINTLPTIHAPSGPVSTNTCPVATVNVRVLKNGTNENSHGGIRFSESVYNFTISNVSPLDSVIGSVSLSADSTDVDTVTFAIDPSTRPSKCAFDVSIRPFSNGTAQLLLGHLSSDSQTLPEDLSCIFWLKATSAGVLSSNGLAQAQIIVTLVDDERQRRQNSYVPNVTISENAPAGSGVFQAASLFDSGPLNFNNYQYSLNDSTGTFSINATNGWITVANSSNVDYEKTSKFLVQITRTAVGSLDIPSSASTVDLLINIADENDNAPVMSVGDHNVLNDHASGSFDFRMNRTWPAGTIIGKLAAQDADASQAGYVRFIPLSVPHYFRLFEDGAIILNESLPDNANSLYSIVFQARDQAPDSSRQRFTLGMAQIHVMDAVARDDQSAPRFSNLPNVVAISESLAIGSIIYTLSVTVAPTPDQLIAIVAGNINNTFAMNGNTVVVAKPLDAEVISLYELRIQLNIAGQTRAIDALSVQILDVNDNRPVFENSRYEFYLNSTSIVPNYIVGTVKANDADISAPNNAVFYELEGDGFGVFSVDGSTGNIRALAPARRNYSDTYRLSIVARDGGQPPLRDTAVVTIHILDVGSPPTVPISSSEPPQFTQLQYSTTISENLSARNISQVSATHDTYQIHYGLVNGFGLFTVDPKSGRVATTGPLDFEQSSEYRLNISACVTTEPQNSMSPMPPVVNSTSPEPCTFATVFVRVLDENDNAPIFDQSEYNARLPVDAVLGSRVIRVHATDNDSDSNGDVSYAMRSDTSHFAVDYVTGWIRTVSTNLMEKTYEVVVEAFDHGRPLLKSDATVRIVVNGTNPHAPDFEKFIYDATVPENSPNGTLVIRVTATDPDPDVLGAITYILPSGGADEQPFVMDPTTGEIRVNGKLDYETRSSYQLMVEAVDHAEFARTGTTLVRIAVQDLNDNPPIFDPLPDRMFISAAKGPAGVIFQVRAADKDGPTSGGGSDTVTYSVEPPSPYFEFQKDSLTVKSRLEPGEYTITLVAKDGGDPPLSSSHSLTIVVLPDSQLYPVFPQLAYELEIKRNASLPEPLETFQAGVKQGHARYTLLPGSIAGLTLDEDSGTLFASPELIDNATMGVPIYVIIRATNIENSSYFSDVSVIINITDHVGPRRPLMFPSSLYRGIMEENLPAGSYTNATISVVEAESFGSKLKYWLYPNDTLTVDSTGRIITVKPIDLESLPANDNGLLSVQAFATNGSSVVSTIVQVKVEDVDEFAPHFGQAVYHVKVSEGIGPGETILKLDAIDEDFSDRMLIFSLANSDSARYVSISPDGILEKSDGLSFDRETNRTVNVTVEAMDQMGKKATADVIIELTDANDNPPQFIGLPYIWNVSEGNDGLEQKFVVSANDADEGENADVSFRILQGNADGLFLMSSSNGSKAELSLVKPLDREEKSQYLLIIEARDHGTPALFSVATVSVNVLDVNDNPPKFFKKQYQQTISADFPVGFPILTVYAQDIDLNSNLTYSLAPVAIHGGNESAAAYFAVRPDSGQIVLTHPLQLQNHTYKFGAVVSDGQFKDQTTVTIEVMWTKGPAISVVNVTVLPPKIPPQFDRDSYNFSVSENEDNATVGHIGIYDLQHPNWTNVSYPTLSIEPEIFRQYFRIDRNGNIYSIQKLSPSSRNLPMPITFFVAANDNSDPPLKTYVPVSVTVIDENDHTPVFSQSDYVGLVPATEKANYTVVLDIRATDEDVGYNAKILYTLQPGNDATCFSIDPNTALIKLLCNPDYYSKNVYNLKVQATDRYGEGNSASADLTILVVPPVDMATDFPTPPVWNERSEGPSPPSGRLTASTRSSTARGSTGTPITGRSSNGSTSGRISTEGTSATPASAGSVPETTGIGSNTEESTNSSSTVSSGTVSETTATATQAVGKTSGSRVPTFSSRPRGLLSTPPTSGFSVDTSRGSFTGSYKVTPANDSWSTTGPGLSPSATSSLISRATPQSDPALPVSSSASSPEPSVSSLRASSPVFASGSASAGPLTSLPGPEAATVPPSESCRRVEFGFQVDDIVLSERTPLNTPVYVAAAKPPSSNRHVICYVTYAISGFGSDYFSMNADNGLMKVAKPLDIGAMTTAGLFADDHTLFLNFTASLVDVGYVTTAGLRVKVEQTDQPVVVADGEVRFEHRWYEFRVPELEPVGTVIGEVHAIANDTGTSVTYTVQSAADTFRFADPKNGTIVSKVVLNYDDPIKSYSFVIQASSGSKNDYATVTVDVIDVNNHAPTFSKSLYQFQIPEGPYGAGAIVGDVDAMDMDSGVNALINYTIVETDVPFRVEPNGRLYAFGTIDREQQSSYMFHVEARDGGIPALSSNATVNVTILDVNDNSPVFENFTDVVLVPDGTPALSVVAQVHADDNDTGLNGHVVYRLRSGADAFVIDQEAGTIRNVIPLFAQKQKEHILSISANDLGRPSRSTVRNMTILVEGTAVGPVFKQDPVYEDVSSNFTIGSPILRMSAGNGSLSYAITGGNENGYFGIKSDTGDIFFASAPTPGGYTLTVTATNTTSHQAASASARIYVYTAQNGTNGGGGQQSRAFDQRIYSVDWPENQPGPAEVTRMQSVYERNRQGAKYEIVKGDQGKFRIDPDTGVVYVQDRLDRENQSMYIMVVRARPVAPRPRRQTGDLLSNVYQLDFDEAILIVNVTDVNDNPPTFANVPPSGVYTFTVPPGIGVRQGVGVVKAFDPDITSIVEYEIIPTGDGNDAAFRIDQSSGQISTAKNLETIDKNMFTVVVQASDGLFKTNATVQIYKAAADKEVIVVSRQAPDVVANYNRTLAKKLSDATGWIVSVDSIAELAQEDDQRSSQLFLSAIDKNKSISVDRDHFVKKLSEVLPAINQDKTLAGLQLELIADEARAAKTVQVISGPEIALIVISGVVILLALLGVLFLLRWWNRKEKQKVSADYMLESNAHGKRPYEVETLDPKKRTETLVARQAEAKPADMTDRHSVLYHRVDSRVSSAADETIASAGRTHLVVIESCPRTVGGDSPEMMMRAGPSTHGHDAER